MKFSSLLLLILALILEVSLTTIPLVFLVLLSLAVLQKDVIIFPIAFLLGIFLDLFTFQTLGSSSAILIIFLFLVLLYQRKFEIATNYFIFAASFLGSFIILLILGNARSIVLESVASSLIGIVLFKTIQQFNKN
jgi:cell shape-determining protein MreD